MLLSACAQNQQSPQACDPIEVSEMPVTFVDGEPTMQVAINGHPLRMLLDTGGAFSIMTPAALKKISGIAAPNLPLSAMGFNGEVVMLPTFVHPFQLGDLKVEGEAFWVAKLFDGRGSALDGTIGEDVISQWNIDLDFPRGKMALFEENGCARRPPGGGAFAEEHFSPGADHAPIFPFFVDHQKFYGDLDSGTVRTVISADALAHAGVTPAKIYGVGSTVGVGGLEGHESISLFSDLTIGGEDFGATWLGAASSKSFKMSESPYGSQSADAFIGEDYLRDHEVYIANENQTIWLGVRVPKAP